ncbi:MAG: selenium metabolism-associated LysR family transcriptional regulator [Nitrospirota bacterium]
MDIHHLKVFVSVFKNRSFSRASEQLNLTQPTISDHIKALEENFGCRLFDRLGRTIMPTREAELLYNHAVDIIEKAENLKEVMGKFKNEITGEIIVGASTIPGTYLIPPVIAEFQKKYPSITFSIIISDSGGIIEKILKHEIIIGLTGSRLGNNRLDYIPFMEDELTVISLPSISIPSSIRLESLKEFPMVIREEGSGTRREMEKILDSRGISPDDLRIAGVFGSTDAVKQAVKAGMGIAILSKFAVRDELKYKIFKEVKLSDMHMKRKFYIVTHKKRALPAAYSAFLSHIKKSSNPVKAP